MTSNDGSGLWRLHCIDAFLEGKLEALPPACHIACMICNTSVTAALDLTGRRLPVHTNGSPSGRGYCLLQFSN